jgi:hypothetical protein
MRIEKKNIPEQKYTIEVLFTWFHSSINWPTDIQLFANKEQLLDTA